jgi:hypothetical protein
LDEWVKWDLTKIKRTGRVNKKLESTYKATHTVLSAGPITGQKENAPKQKLEKGAYPKCSFLA